MSGQPELRKRFLSERPGQRSVHLHIRQEKRINQRYPLLFRDYLRTDEVVRDAYESVKRVLARTFHDDIDAYYEIKDPYMDTIYQAARLWAQIRHWSPDQDFR